MRPPTRIAIAALVGVVIIGGAAVAAAAVPLRDQDGVATGVDAITVAPDPTAGSNPAATSDVTGTDPSTDGSGAAGTAPVAPTANPDAPKPTGPQPVRPGPPIELGR